MRLTILTGLFVILLCGSAAAQTYSQSIGIRGGTQQGITYKKFVSGNNALEGILGFRRNGFVFTGLYQIHAGAFDVPRLNWFYGAGGHIGFFGADDHHVWDRDPFMTLGVDGIIGLEYHIQEIPFAISIDFKPYFNFIGNFGPHFDSGAISIRYTF